MKMPKTNLNCDKIKDIMSLLKFLKSDNKKFYVNYFSKFDDKTISDLNID